LVPDLPTADDGLMATVSISCEGDPSGGWSCDVTIREGDRQVSSHAVRVRGADLARLDPGATDPTELVTASFAFLLDREPPGSILRSFDLTDIAHYFPEYERAFPVMGPRSR
jgi:hypothetical protein